MRELGASTNKNKELIALVDLDASRGGMSLEAVHTQLLNANDMYVKWGFQTKVSRRGGQEERTNEWHKDNDWPGGQVLSNHLFAHEPIEWNRIGHFQDVTMRLIAERLLPNAIGATYVDREIVNQNFKPLRQPNAGFHVYCSVLNPGAIDFMHEVCSRRHFDIQLEKEATAKTSNKLFATAKVENLTNCDHFVLYLTDKTWTCGDTSQALGTELMKAMDLGVHVMLVHEMPGGGGQDARFGCEFGTFFCHPDGATPPELLTRGIYSEIAVPLKGGAWREASMALMGVALGLSKEEAAEAQEGKDLLGVDDEYVREVAKRFSRVSTGLQTLATRNAPSYGSFFKETSATVPVSLVVTSSTASSADDTMTGKVIELAV